MPLYLEAPKPGRSPNWRIRGSHLGTAIDQSSGTPRREVAVKIKRALEEKIERGEYRPNELNFLTAVDSYTNAHDPSWNTTRYVKKLAAQLGALPLSQITQALVDAAAVALYPNASPATRNRQVYTPLCAILEHADHAHRIRRPKGSKGTPRLHWLTPEEATRLVAGAVDVDPVFGALMAFLFATGCRIADALNLEGRNLDLVNGVAFIARTKNDDPRAAYLPASLVAMLGSTPGLGIGDARVFGGFQKTRAYDLLDEACQRSGVDIPDGIAFHITCHSWATWMRRYGGADTRALVATGRWKSAAAANVYQHAIASEESRRADLIPLKLPVRGTG